MSILIAIPHTGEIRVELAQWLFELAKHRNKEDEVKLLFSYMQPIDVNRNMIVKRFLTDKSFSDCEWLLMLDSDHVPKNDLTRLCTHGKKVVGGLTVVSTTSGGYKTIMPLIMKKASDVDYDAWTMMCPDKSVRDKAKDADELKREIIKTLSECEDKKTGLIKVDGLGTGIIAIHRSVLEEMKPPYFEFTMNEDGTLKVSEDYNFCLKLKEMGVEMFLDLYARAGHVKNIDLWDMNEMLARSVREAMKKDSKMKAFTSNVPKKVVLNDSA